MDDLTTDIIVILRHMMDDLTTDVIKRHMMEFDGCNDGWMI